MAGQKHQFETVVYFINAIFNCDAGHCLSFMGRNVVDQSAVQMERCTGYALTY
ncbi:hypothetical protein AT6N2_C1330 [Agrobacterium tumefaciens]|nr:hypothetical protein AT6N2_C1330 [Agrobacterium tumefaciens]